MASGVQVSDEVLTCFQDMKVHKVDEVKKKRKKAVIFCLSCCQKFIVPEEGREILEEDVGDAFQQVIDMLPPNECRYALYDATYETRESKKQDLVFIFWAPECAAIKNKMLYASSKDSIKKKFTGIKHEWQVNSMEDLRDRTGFAKKLGGDSVVSLEGVAL